MKYECVPVKKTIFKGLKKFPRLYCYIYVFLKKIYWETYYIAEGYFVVANMRVCVCVKRSFLQKIKPSLEFVIILELFFQSKIIKFFCLSNSFEFFSQKIPC